MTEEATKSLVFHSNGQIDPKSWELMGISAKETDHPIGLFGTGLKYALSVLLREGHDIQIHSNGQTWVFGLTDMTFRGKEFKQVTCNGQTLPFTTEYGKNWKTAGAYRELVSNTLDEGGLWFVGDGPVEGGTSIVITGQDILKCHENHDQYFVGDREPIHESKRLRIYNGSGKIFYRGVKVAEVEHAHYDYEILSKMDLTEDRTVSNTYALKYLIGDPVCKEVKDKRLLELFVTMKGFEGDLDYDNSWSEEMTEVVEKVWELKPNLLNESIRMIHKRKNPTSSFKVLEMDDEKEAMLERAKEFLSLAGYTVNARIVIVQSEDSNLLGYFHAGDIHLTGKAFEKGVYDLAHTLFEENAHSSGHDDYSHSFQHYLIGEVLSQAKRRLKFPL